MAVPALAADPVDDGALTVTVQLPSDAGGGPLAGADVVLSLHRDGLALSEGVVGSTDADGVVAFAGLPRATDGSPVLIDIEASWHEPIPPDECGEVPAWTASALGIVSEPGAAVSLVASATTYYGCGGGTGTAPDLDNVVLDGVLDVTVPVAGLESAVYVTMGATLEGGEAIWTAFAWTDGAGRASFSGLPRPAVDGPPISWSVEASYQDHFAVDGCDFGRYGQAAADVPAGAGITDLDLELAYSVEGEGCVAPPEGSPVVTALAVDASGGPVTELYFLAMTQVRADGGRYAAAVTAAGDGTFEARVHAWGTTAEPSRIEISATGPVTRTEDADGCQTTFALLGSTSVEVAFAEFVPTDVVVVTLAEDVLQKVCGETDGPSSGSSGGGPIALPETDTQSAGGPAALPIVIAGLLGGLAVGLRRPRVVAERR